MTLYPCNPQWVRLEWDGENWIYQQWMFSPYQGHGYPTYFPWTPSYESVVKQWLKGAV